MDLSIDRSGSCNHLTGPLTDLRSRIGQSGEVRVSRGRRAVQRLLKVGNHLG